MNDRRVCPNCNSHATERAWTDWETDRVIEIRICNGCGAEYENDFGDPLQRVTHDPDDVDAMTDD